MACYLPNSVVVVQESYFQVIPTNQEGRHAPVSTMKCGRDYGSSVLAIDHTENENS
jgi:hypothetical protein